MGDYTLPADDWRLITKWCMVAVQAKADGDSHVVLKINPAFLADKSFLDWYKWCIDTTMGLQVREIGGQFGGQGEQPQQGGQAQLMTTTANVMRSMGNQMVAGLQQAMTASAMQGGGSGGDGALSSGLGGFVKKYSRSHIAQLKGFCCSEDITCIPPIWYIFSTTKDVDTYRSEIERQMEKWGRGKGVEIDLRVYFEDESLKAIAQLQFNPSGGGAGVALAQSADKGLSILLCRPRTLGEIERVRDDKQAMAAASSTVTVEQAKKLKSGVVCKPPSGTYLELKLLIGTFCRLLYMLFGSGCDYYHELRKIHTALCARDVAAIQNAFTVDKCRQIVWAILDDGRAFFCQKLLEADFSDPEGFAFLASLLSAIYGKVRYAQVIERPFYPQSWMVGVDGGADTGGYKGMGNSNGGTSGNGRGGGGGGIANNNSRPGGSGGGGSQKGGGGSPGTAIGWGGQWSDNRHPAIKVMMKEYEATTGLGLRINLGQVLDMSKREIRDLPIIPACVANGRPFLCWAHILGRCHFGDTCRFAQGHLARRAIPDQFAKELVGLLEGGIEAMVTGHQMDRCGGGSPVKKQRAGDK